MYVKQSTTNLKKKYASNVMQVTVASVQVSQGSTKDPDDPLVLLPASSNPLKLNTAEMNWNYLALSGV